MARKRDRAFAAFGAILFLVTSSALTIAVIYTSVTQKNSSPTTTTQPTTKKTETTMQNFTPTTTPTTQLQVIDTKVGTGAVIKPTDTITADYVGALMSTGVVFDASANHGGAATFPLNQVIAGWTQGLTGMKVGGTRRLLIPAALGYGAHGSGSTIPPNSDLVFDVTVEKIK